MKVIKLLKEWYSMIKINECYQIIKRMLFSNKNKWMLLNYKKNVIQGEKIRIKKMYKVKERI